MQITKIELEKLSTYEKNYLNFLSEYRIRSIMARLPHDSPVMV